MNPQPRVVIMGNGQMGKALGRAASKNARVSYWDAVPGRVLRQRPLADVLPMADIVLFCVPSWYLRQALVDCVPHISTRAVSIFISKGLEVPAGLSAYAVARAVLVRQRNFGFIGGPMLGNELLKGKMGVGVIASDRPSVIRTTLALFDDTNVMLEKSSDLTGVTLSGILKNIYALGLGIVNELGLGLNVTGWYVAQASTEGSRLVGRLGGRPETFFTAAGLGDFVATGFSPRSRDRLAGGELIRHGACRTESEGYRSLPLLKKKLGHDDRRYPLLFAIARTISAPRRARKIFEKLLPMRG